MLDGVGLGRKAERSYGGALRERKREIATWKTKRQKVSDQRHITTNHLQHNSLILTLYQMFQAKVE